MITADRNTFLDAIRRLTASLGWQVRSFERDGEYVAVVGLDNDICFEQMLWVYNPEGAFVRCLLVARGEVRAERLAQSLELCARINDGLAFGCAEYSFDDRVVLLRDSLPFTGNDLDGRLSRASARLLQLGAHYAPAIRATLDGTSATEAGE